MKYIKSPVYVQRQINDILQKFCIFAYVYVNDIVIFNKILKKHLKHLQNVFQLFQKMNIALKFNKIYLKYFTIALLN